jgi:methyl-accepting chemotaxis protein
VSRYKRRQYLIKKGLQIRYMGVILSALLLVSAVVAWEVYFTVWREISNPTVPPEKLIDLFVKGNQVLAGKVVLAIILICIVSIFVSHKIAGPVYRLEESAKTIAAGDLSLRIRLRAGDELHDLAVAFNAMTESLEMLIREDRMMLERISRVVEKVKEDFQKKTISDKRKSEIIGEFSKIVEDLAKITTTFTIRDDSPEYIDMDETTPIAPEAQV